jgi:hypothetical protein
MGLGPAERDRATRNAGNVRGQIIDRDHLRRHTIENLLGEGAFKADIKGSSSLRHGTRIY